MYFIICVSKNLNVLVSYAAMAAKWKEPPRDALDTLTLTAVDMKSLDLVTQLLTNAVDTHNTLFTLRNWLLRHTDTKVAAVHRALSSLCFSMKIGTRY